MKLPSPRETLAGCVWLPRILGKAGLLQRGGLPPDYEARFCHQDGIDGFFLRHFGLEKKDILHAASLGDEEAARWFLAIPRNSEIQIRKWNEIALNLGRSGYPLAERFPVAKATVYAHVKSEGMTTVFELLEADEATPAQT